MNNTLVAINITNKGVLYNPTNVPILFYWDGDKTITEKIIEDESFIKLINDKIMNINLYPETCLNWFYFIYDGNSENYTESGDIYIQDILPFKSLYSLLWQEYVEEIFKELYKTVYKKDYENILNVSIVDAILEMYRSIKSKRPLKIQKNTVIEYIRSQLKDKYKLSQENADYVYDKLNEIIEDE